MLSEAYTPRTHKCAVLGVTSMLFINTAYPHSEPMVLLCTPDIHSYPSRLAQDSSDPRSKLTTAVLLLLSQPVTTILVSQCWIHKFILPHPYPSPNELLKVRNQILFIYMQTQCLVHGWKIQGTFAFTLGFCIWGKFQTNHGPFSFLLWYWGLNSGPSPWATRH
jgi:hypothetical protein